MIRECNDEGRGPGGAGHGVLPRMGVDAGREVPPTSTTATRTSCSRIPTTRGFRRSTDCGQSAGGVATEPAADPVLVRGMLWRCRGGASRTWPCVGPCSARSSDLRPDVTGPQTCPADCREIAHDAGRACFGKLDDWDHDAIVIPARDRRGASTRRRPRGGTSSCEGAMHDPDRQTLIESVLSGHGDSRSCTGTGALFDEDSDGRASFRCPPERARTILPDVPPCRAASSWIAASPKGIDRGGVRERRAEEAQ